MTISRIQFATGTDQLTGTTIVTLGSAPTNGNTLIAVIGDAATITVASITQTGVTWAKAVANNNNPGSEIWYGAVGSGASAVITVTKSSVSSDTVAIIAEYSGLSTTVDQTAINTGNSSSIDSGTTSTTTQASELWVAAPTQTSITQSTYSSPTNGFTIVTTSSVNNGLTTAYVEKIVSTTGTANVSVTSSLSNFWVGAIATFLGSTTATTVNQLMMTGLGM